MLKKIARFLFKRKVVIPEYSEKRSVILSYKNQYQTKTFVETGTFMGDTIQALINDFDKLYSIELADELALRAQKRFAGQEKVKIIHGDSDTELGSILAQVKQPTLFWLDGHYSGEFVQNNEFIKTAKGRLNTPVISELKQVLSTNIPHVILIDDARLFNGHDDYPTISHLKKLIKTAPIKRALSVKRDIIRIVPID